MAEHGADAREADRKEDEAVPPGTMFFISYSRKTDLPRAESLYQALLGQGVTHGEVWFDRHSIEPGQDFQRRILDGIRSCRYFLPLLSRACNSRERAFVFTEWVEANKLLTSMNRDFVFPVIVDADFEPERYTHKAALQWVDEHLDFAHAPEGVPDGRLQAKLKKLVRDARGRREPS